MDHSSITQDGVGSSRSNKMTEKVKDIYITPREYQNTATRIALEAARDPYAIISPGKNKKSISWWTFWNITNSLTFGSKNTRMLSSDEDSREWMDNNEVKIYRLSDCLWGIKDDGEYDNGGGDDDPNYEPSNYHQK
ncbi:hypothetical protein Tco_0287092 [Tanacetum coccineum]